jgi:hypothetical protein
MQHDRTKSHDPARLELKRCSACAEVKRAEDFYESRGRLSSAAYDENAQPSQHRVATVTRRAVQARLQARQQRTAARAEQTRTRELAARTHQRLLARQTRQPAGSRRPQRPREERDRER